MLSVSAELVGCWRWCWWSRAEGAGAGLRLEAQVEGFNLVLLGSSLGSWAMPWVLLSLRSKFQSLRV